MITDKQTHKDLEIFKSEEGEVTVFDLIDKTKTTGGKYRLRDKFLNPPAKLEDLKEQQEAIRYLNKNLNEYVLPFGNNQMKSLDDYISTNIEAVKSDSYYECIKFCFIDIQAYRYLKSSLYEVIGFIHDFYRLFNENKEKLPGLLRKINADFDSLFNNGNFQYITTLLKKPTISFYQVLQSDRILRTSLKARITTITGWYYEIDALLSMARATKELRFQFPEFTDIEHVMFEAEGLYHPLLNNPITANILLTKETNSIFLTGPNMSGKTTLMKAVGLTVYLAHLGMGVPVLKLRMKYFDRLFTSLNITDNILTGYSFFFNEVKRVKQLAESLNSGERVFSLLDELFRGTNVKDAYDASAMVISGLLSWRNSIFIISSHLWEVWEKIEQFPNIMSLYFESEIIDGKPSFSYHLKSGVSDMRLGMIIIENEKIMDLLKHPEHDKN